MSSIQFAALRTLAPGVGVPVVLASRAFSAGAIFSITGTNAAQSVQIADLAGLLEDGDCLQIDVMVSMTPSTNAKTIAVGFGAGSNQVTALSTVRNAASAAGFIGQGRLCVVGGNQIQRLQGWFLGDQSAAVPPLVAFDPTNLQLYFQGQLASAAETLALHAYTVTRLRVPK